MDEWCSVERFITITINLGLNVKHALCSYIRQFHKESAKPNSPNSNHLKVNFAKVKEVNSPVIYLSHVTLSELLLLFLNQNI